MSSDSSKFHEHFTVGQLMNDLHIVAKSEDSSIDWDELSPDEKARMEEDVLYALAEVTDYSIVELNEMLSDFFTELTITEEEAKRMEMEDRPVDERVDSVVDRKLEDSIDQDEIAEMVTEKLFGNGDK